ncbi:MAG: hypothetical protein JNK37_04810 [Verrucomicrobiales bacterium]|nr:hypothetical protein [Verrucomicrobiales bacterium]
MKPIVVIVAFFVLFALHQDTWNWSDSTLWFGFLPAGLGYHAAYSVVVSIFWLLVSRLAWPSRVEQWAEEGSDSPH